ncbi:MAG: hypothetical protein WBP11_03560 [Dokdonella sp.]
MRWLGLGVLLGGLTSAFATSLQTAATAPTSPAWAWSVADGDVGIRWNAKLLDELGMPVEQTMDGVGGNEVDAPRIAFDGANALVVSLRDLYFEGFQSGALQARGGWVLRLQRETLDLSRFVLRPSAADALGLDLIGRDGQTWFQLIRPMSEFSDDRRTLHISTMDVTVTAALASRLGRPEIAGWTVGDASINATTTALPAPEQPAATFNWPGDPAPNGGTYKADLFMSDLLFQYMRCDGCSGPGGSGRIVFAPTSKLRNNANTGTVQVYTVGNGNDPLGASTAMWPAGIAWYAKFSGDFAPYGNDQHPYLVWNMYRTNADGSIQQIGRSGAKHAYLTTNHNCTGSNDHDNHVLGRGCEDTYTMSHNDNPNALSPRSEIVAATGQWGRCGSIYDPVCIGQPSASGNGNYDQRMLVDESQISEYLHPGASYLMESWYVTRDDINIYNSMATVRAVPQYSGGWNVNDQSEFWLGPAIDRWVEPGAPDSNAANVQLMTPEGHIKIAVKATYIGFAKWRYDYAFANMDFARADVDCCEPNLRVKSNKGIREIRIPITGAGVTTPRFVDADMDASNNWTVSQSGGYLIFTAPTGSNSLDWGSLYSASFVSPATPVRSDLNLVVAHPGTPSSYNATGLFGPAASDIVFRSGFD